MTFRSLLISCFLLAGCDRTETPNLEPTQVKSGSPIRNSGDGTFAKNGERPTDPPVFNSHVSSLSNPTIVGVEMCSRDRMRCVWDTWKEVCQVTGEAEIIFNFNDGRGYLRLSDDDTISNVILHENSAEDADMKTFESDDGTLRVTLAISNSNVSRGRAEGPGLVGEMIVELNGARVPYPYPSPQTRIHGSINCNPING